MNAQPAGEPAPRVALLARAGAACERLQTALRDAGADIVLVSDPADSDVAGVRASGAQAILIALEPMVEEALDRYDALLADPAMTVIFDEAELAAQREGWDAARWSRHLAAKLNRHQEVLPPGAGVSPADDDAGGSTPGDHVATADAQPIGASSAVAFDALALGEPAPTDGNEHGAHAFDPVSAESDAATPVPFDPLDTNLELDWNASLSPVRSQQPAVETDHDIGAFLSDIMLEGLDLPGDRPLAATTAAAAPDATGEAPHPFDPAFADFDAESDAAFALPGFASPAIDVPLKEASSGIRAIAVDEVAPDEIALLELDKPPTQDNAASDQRFRMDLDALELRIADMQLEDVRPVRAPSQDGAVLVMAGIGGPDAVRQLLAGLPATFPRAVLIRQRLEGGRHDNLVRQMQRATKMPVRMAEVGAPVERGNVYVLSADTGIAQHPDGLQFASGSDSLPGALPAADSAVVLLSGSDPASVDAALALGVRGTFVAGQSAEGCFDAVASETLVARGGESASPAELARKLAQRWPS